MCLLVADVQFLLLGDDPLRIAYGITCLLCTAVPSIAVGLPIISCFALCAAWRPAGRPSRLSVCIERRRFAAELRALMGTTSESFACDLALNRDTDPNMSLLVDNTGLINYSRGDSDMNGKLV